MQRLQGHIIREFNLCDEGYDLVILTDTHRFTFRTEGDCCANAYLLAPEREDITNVIGQTVISVTSSEVIQTDGGCDAVMDTEFYSIKTQFADLDLELRTEHNGYYGGWITFVAEETL